MADDTQPTAPAGLSDVEWLNWMAAHGYPSLAGPNAPKTTAAPAASPAPDHVVGQPPLVGATSVPIPTMTPQAPRMTEPIPNAQPTPRPDTYDANAQPYRMAPLGAPMRHLLEGIAGPESGGAYNVRYAGNTPQYFTGYDKHPNIAEKIPGTDQTSTAAGKYQFLNSTWQQVARQLGLKDFSPQSQDQGAAYLARSTYKTATGRDLDADLADPSKFSTIASTLHSQWPSITGKNVATAMGQPLPPEPDATTPPAATPPVASAQPDQSGLVAQLQAMQKQQLQLQQYNALQKLIQPPQQAQAVNPWLQGNSWLQPILASQTNPTQANYQAMQQLALASNQLSPTQQALGPYQASLMNPLKTQGT